ncbi:MAG: MFS transporter [Alphaproteobacteria bacterium]
MIALPRPMALLALVLCMVLGLTGRGLLESFVVFLLPLSADFGWDRADVVSIYSFATLASGVSGPLVGRMFDRAGPRMVYMTGLALLGGGLTLASRADALWQFQLCLGLALGMGAACLGNVPNATLIRRWYDRRLTLAMSIAFSAFGIGILLVVPLAQFLIERWGWRSALTALGGAALAMLPVLLLLPWRRLAAGRPDVVRADRGAGGQPQSQTLGAAMRHSGFWGIFAVYFFTSVAMFAIIVQVVAYLVSIGFRPIDAATAWGFSGMLLPVGMILVGWLDGLVGRRPSVLFSYSLSLAGIVQLWLLSFWPSPWLLAGFVACFGGMLGSRGPLLSTITVRLFGGPKAATIFGTITMGTGFGSAFGSWAGGLLHDWTGSYEAVIAFAAVSVMIAILPFFTVPSMRGQEVAAR